MKTRVHSDERAAHAGRDIHLLPDSLFAAGKDRLAPRMIAVQTFRHFQYFAEVFAQCMMVAAALRFAQGFAHQVFDQDGTLLQVWPTTLIGPAFFYVDADDIVYMPEHNGGLVSVLTLEGERLAQWGDPSFRSCHGIWGDSRGDLYVVRPGAWGRPRRVVKYVRLN